MELPDPTHRYRCQACGNLTRFDVLERLRARRFYHFTLGGDRTIEEEDVLEHQVETVTCRWCGSTAVDVVPVVGGERQEA